MSIVCLHMMQREPFNLMKPTVRAASCVNSEYIYRTSPGVADDNAVLRIIGGHFDDYH